MRDFLLQQIESLKNLKQVYLMYARRKANEITLIQNEIYGEEAVREAFNEENTDHVEYDTTDYNNSVSNEEMIGEENSMGNSTQVMNEIDESDTNSTDETAEQTRMISQQSEFRPHHQPHHFIDNPVF